MHGQCTRAEKQHKSTNRGGSDQIRMCSRGVRPSGGGEFDPNFVVCSTKPKVLSTKCQGGRPSVGSCCPILGCLRHTSGNLDPLEQVSATLGCVSANLGTVRQNAGWWFPSPWRLWQNSGRVRPAIQSLGSHPGGIPAHITCMWHAARRNKKQINPTRLAIVGPQQPVKPPETTRCTASSSAMMRQLMRPPIQTISGVAVDACRPRAMHTRGADYAP